MTWSSSYHTRINGELVNIVVNEDGRIFEDGKPATAMRVVYLLRRNDDISFEYDGAGKQKKKLFGGF